MRLILLSPLLLYASTATASSANHHAFLRGLGSQDCTDCIINGVGYCDGDSYPNPSCLPNTCGCSASSPPGVAACTLMACERNCGDGAVCTHDGRYYCAGDVFYDSTCMPNTCRCSDTGGVGCTKMACFDECQTDDDCEAAVRNQTAQPDLYEMCQCEARSLDGFISSRFDECLGEDATRNITCATADCDDTCKDYRAVCESNKCILAWDGGTDDIQSLDKGDEDVVEDDEEKLSCIQDVSECPDGSFVGRDPEDNCEFKPCPDAVDEDDEGLFCIDDVSECSDGSYVGRDPDNNCEFKPCPDEIEGDEGGVACAQDVRECSDGSYVARDPMNSCRFRPCPDEIEGDEGGIACAQDVRECSDGSYVARDPMNSCRFRPCPDEIEGDEGGIACAQDVRECSDGSYVARDPMNSCRFRPCPDEIEGDEGGIACAQDVRECSDGSYVARDPMNNCRFKPCPSTVAIAADDAGEVKKCAGCEAHGICYPVGEKYTAEDGCNSCTCGNEDGIAACTMKACPPCDTCEVDGKMYCEDQAFLASDGCNTCRCSANGEASCTKMACPEQVSTQDASVEKDGKEPKDCAGCLAHGICYAVGDPFTAEDGCNSCTCGNEDGIAACTVMACPPCDTCDVDGKMYCEGQKFLASDGCNTCTCSDNGMAACTMMACPDVPTQLPEDVQPMQTDVDEPQDEPEDDPTSGASVSSIGAATLISVYLGYFAMAIL